MKKQILGLLIICLIAISTFGQKYATTEDGKKVKLNTDGTWEYVEENNTSTQTSFVFVGGKRLICGITSIVHEETKVGMSTSITIAKDGEKTLIIFWQETIVPSMNSFNWLWTGTVTLYLESGETISLLDRKINGQNKITSSSKYGSDLYQRFSAYYLTSAECIILKNSNLSQIAYKTTSSFETGTTYLDVTENSGTIKEQLLAIKR